MKYYVRWAPCPTNHYPTALSKVEDLSRTVVRDRDSLTWSTEKCLMLGVDKHVIFKIWTEESGGVQVYYEGRGYASPYISPQMDALLAPPPKEVFV